MSQTDSLLQDADVKLNEHIAGNGITKNEDSITDAEKPKLPPIGYINFVIRVKECVEGGENIDIYQYIAWKDKQEGSKVYRCILTHEVIMCILAQIIGIIVILKQVIEDGMDNKDSCNDSPIELKLLAFALSSVAGYISADVFMYEKGMYNGGIQDCRDGSGIQVIDIIAHPPKWISLFWFSVGIWVNRIVSIGAVGGSFMVIFFSADAFDMVLNSVALFFLMELDDMLMTQHKYDEMKEYLKEWPEDLKEEDGEIKKEYQDGTQEFYSLARPSKDYPEGCCCFFVTFMAAAVNMCCFCCYTFFGIFFIIACIVIPVYIGVCY